MVQLITCDPDDGASLIVEPLDDYGDIMGGDLFRCEASGLEEATPENWESRYPAAVADNFSFEKIVGQQTVEENRLAGLSRNMQTYEWVKQWLYDYGKKNFPRCSFVRVTNPRYHGIGMVVGACNEPDKVCVKLENGNDWWYELNTCEVVTDLKHVPQEMRRIKMRYRGMKVMAGYGPRRALP